jgi:hypothetical protein
MNPVNRKPHPFDFAQGRLSRKKREKWGTLGVPDVSQHARPSQRTRNDGAPRHRYGKAIEQAPWKYSGLCGQRLPKLDFVSIRVIDPGKATVGFIHTFVVNLYALLF